MNPSAPMPLPESDLILGNIRKHLWKSRALAFAGFAFGLVAITLSVAIAWGNAMLVIPQLVHLLKSYPHDGALAGPNSLDWQHVQVSAALGKTSVLMAASVVLLGVGTLLTLLLVIVTRRVTLNQISVTLVELSRQIKELQQGQGPESKS